MDACELPTGYVSDAADCDDADAADYPGADETIANGDDEDCDGGERFRSFTSTGGQAR